MSTVKPLRNKAAKTSVNRPSVTVEQQLSIRAHTTRQSRPRLGEMRRAPLLLHDLRPLALLLKRAQQHLPAALRKDCEREEAKVCAAIAFVEQHPPQARKVRDRVTYLVELPGREPFTVNGATELAKAVRRSANYLQKRLSQGNGVARLQREHLETGNPDELVITRLGMNFAPQQEPCQEPKNAVGERNREAPSNSSDD